MPSRNTVSIIINAEDNASDVLHGVTGELQSIGEAALAITGAALAAASAAVVGFGAASLDAFNDFQVGIQEVFTLLPGITEDAMRAMEGDVQQFMNVTGRLSEETIPALYQALSAGIPKENVFDFLNIANQAAVGGVTDLETAVDGITSILNAYGLSADHATEVSDAMFTAVRIGKTTFEELSASAFQLMPVMAGVGGSFTDALAAVTALTAQGVPTSVAFTQVRQAVVELSDAGTEVGEMFQNLAGQSFQDFLASGHDLADAFALLEDEATRLDVPISQLFGSVEAGNAALALTGSGMETFRGNIEAMGDSAGATQAAFNQMNQGIGMALNRLGARWESLLISMGRLIEPFVTPIVEGFSTIVAYIAATLDTGDALNDWLANLPTWLRPSVALLGEFALWILEVADALGSMFSAISAGIDPLTAFQHFLYEVAGADVANAFADITLAIMGFFDAVGQILQPVIDWVAANVELQDVLLALGIAIASVVIPAVIAFFAAFAPLVILIGTIALLRTAWEENWGGIQQVAENVMVTIGQLGVLIPYWLNQASVAAQQLGTLFGIAVAFIVTKFIEFSLWVGDILNQAWETASQIGFLIGWAFGEIGNAIGGFIDAAIAKFLEFVNWLGEVWDAAWLGVVTFFLGLWNAISEGIDTFKAGMDSAFQWIVDNVLLPAQTVWQGIVTFFVGLWDAVSAGIEAFKAGFAAAFTWIQTNVIDPFMAALQPVIDAVNSVTGQGGTNMGNAGAFAAANSASITGSGGFGGHQFGGGVRAGIPTWVGEQGRELFVPPSDGNILNNRDSELASQGGTKVNITINISGSISDRDAKEAAYKIKRELQSQGVDSH